MSRHSFVSLSREHQVFLDFLRLKDTNPSQFYDRNRWKILNLLLEKIHHEKEESFLFPYLLQIDALKSGGVKCATFFTPRVLNAVDWPDSYHQMKQSLNPFEKEVDDLSPFRKKVFETKSMLSIPVEDHMLGAVAMREIFRSPNYLRLMDQFAGLLFDHIQREEDCLFEVCERELNSEEKVAHIKNSEKIDLWYQTKTKLTELLAP